jgi:D-alanyl-lipoteichoic acid acyltransferase DltB (MBOAT superfamily)
MHGAALVMERTLGITGREGSRRLPPVIAWLVTFHFVCFAWIFFRSQTFDSALDYFRVMFSLQSFSLTMTPLVALIFIFGALTQIIPDRVQTTVEMWYERSSLALKITIPVVVIWLIAVASPDGVPPFIYFQF